MRQIIVLLLSALLASPAAALVVPLSSAVLDVDFDDKPLGEPVGVGGAALDEPVSLSALDTTVVDRGGGNRALQVSNDLSSTSARRLRWAFEDDQEISQGPLLIRFTLRAAEQDRFSVLVREALGSARNFMSMSLSEAGNISISDAAGVVTVSGGSYSAATDHVFELDFDLDGGTYDVRLDGAEIVSDRAHGIGDRGVGAVLIGYQAGSAGRPFLLDDLRAEVTLPTPALDVVLDASFDDKPLGEPIGTGGALPGEPVSIGNSLTTEIVDSLPGERALQVSASPQPFVQNIRWQLLDDIEIDRGLVVFQFGFRAGALDNYALLFRESGGSAQRFLNLGLRNNGEIVADDASGGLGVIGHYTDGVTHQFEVLFDLDAGTLRIVQDGQILVRDRAHGVVGSGIGGLITGFDNAATGSGGFVLESILVKASRARAIPASLIFLREPSDVMAGSSISPAIEVGVLNVFGNPLTEPAEVRLLRASGNPDVLLSGGLAQTETSVARFDALSLDTPGSYTLRATAAEAEIESRGFEVFPGLPADIQFIAQPGNGNAGSALSPAISLMVTDALGNPVADGTQVRLEVESGPAGATLDGATAFTVDGIAIFAALRLDLAGTYVLRASAGGAEVLSAAFGIAAPRGDEIFDDGFE